MKTAILPKLISFLTLDSRGYEVRTLQALLQGLGYYPQNSKISGYYDIMTRNAVLNFQKANKISPRGYVGPQTRVLLNSLMNL